MDFLSTDLLVIPGIVISVFIVTYLWSDKVLNFLYDKSLGSRKEVIEILDKMMVDLDKEKLTMTLLLLSFGLGIVFFLLLWPNLIMGVIVGAGVTLAGWQAPKSLLNYLWEKRCNNIVDQMVDGLTIMGNSLGANLTVAQAMSRVIDNLKGPLSQEFQLILKKTQLGMSLEDGLNEFAERIPRDDVKMFVITVNILKETGGNLAETFATTVYTIRERQKLEKKIDAMTAKGVTQAQMVSAVPFLLLIIFYVSDPNYIMPLFTKPLGWFALFVMLALQIIGGIVMKKMVTIKV